MYSDTFWSPAAPTNRVLIACSGQLCTICAQLCTVFVTICAQFVHNCTQFVYNCAQFALSLWSSSPPPSSSLGGQSDGNVGCGVKTPHIALVGGADLMTDTILIGLPPPRPQAPTFPVAHLSSAMMKCGRGHCPYVPPP